MRAEPLFLNKWLGPTVNGAGFHATHSGTAGWGRAPGRTHEIGSIFRASRARGPGGASTWADGRRPSAAGLGPARRGKRENAPPVKKNERTLVHVVHVILTENIVAF